MPGSLPGRSGGTARRGVAGLFGASLVLSGTCLLLLPRTSGTLAIVLLTIGWGALLVFPMAPTAVSFAVHPMQRAVVISTLIGLASLGRVIAPSAVGAFVGTTGYAAGADAPWAMGRCWPRASAAPSP